MRCIDAYRFICDNLDQSVDSPECREIRRHIEGCPDCQSYLDSLKKTVVLYRAETSAKSVPPAVHRRLMKIIKVNAASRTPSRKRQRNSSQK
ncbi:MAG TPA: zf-HC2 domain-containing protein [Bacteroidota bacterium]|nr:zf-HC2 domain-containing protein [Bacteroidota bacterium]